MAGTQEETVNTLAVTGHRPPRLGGYSTAARDGLVQFATICLEDIRPDLVITGMAQGWDQAIAEACMDSGLPYLAAVPFREQPLSWPPKERRIYYRLLKGAREIRFVGDPGYSVEKMHARNRWMVDQSDHVLALWDGGRSGTSFCVGYAEKVGVPVTNVWDGWLLFKGGSE